MKRLLVAALLAAACVAPRFALSADKRVFRAGAYAIDTAPRELPVIVNGGMTERKLDKVTDPLHARCLVLDDGTNEIALAVVDNCVIPRDLMDEAKHLATAVTGIPETRIMISATHAHSTPSVFAVLGSDRDERYARFLPGRIAEGIWRAQKNLAPARIGWAVGKEPNHVFCRRFLMKPGTARTVPFTGHSENQAQMNPGFQNPNAMRPTGPADTDVSVLAIQAPDGRPMAVLGNYSTHYAGAPGISADYFAVFAAEIQKLVGAADNPAFMGAMTNGTSGDANCNDYTKPRQPYTYITVGEDAAYAAYKTIQWFDWVPIVMEEARLTLPIRMPPAAEVAEAKQAVAKFAGRKPKTVDEVYARETVILSQTPPVRELKLQAIRLGGLGIATMPNEVFGITGLSIKKESPLRPTFNIELANGYDGYLPPPDQHKLGGYTTWRARSSCLEEQAEPKIRSQVLKLLARVAKERSDEQPVPAKQ